MDLDDKRMDYSVGSLSDLITGSNTPNKPKVVQRQITPSQTRLEDENVSPKKSPKKKKSLDATSNLEVVKSKKSLKRKADAESAESPKIKKKNTVELDKKKRKSEESGDSVPKKRIKLEENNEDVPKKSKNDENAERRVRKKEKTQKLEENPEQLERTIFVGNLPITTKKEKLKKFFAKFGAVDSVRIRGVPVANPKTTKKVAVIKKEFHPDRKSFTGYVRFMERESAVKACEADGILYREHHLRVNLCDAKQKPDESKAIFVGNLSFSAEEEDLWQLFAPCGEIASVRIVRDGRTGMGKGFGYVNFKSSDSVQLALEMEDVKLKDRQLRISLCNVGAAKKNKKNNKMKKVSKPGKPKSPKKHFQKDSQENNNPDVNVKAKGFEGAKFAEKKKKNKLNKGLLQKKKMIKKLAPKAK